MYIAIQCVACGLCGAGGSLLSDHPFAAFGLVLAGLGVGVIGAIADIRKLI